MPERSLPVIPEGWDRDPFGVHQERFHKDGAPTALVRDDGIGSYDPPPGTPRLRSPSGGGRRRRRRGAPAFVLVHSPLAGPVTWRWVGAVLERWGFEVVVPSMTGFEGAGPRYWEPCVQAVVMACDGVPGPLVVAGLGEAGPLLPAVAQALLGRVGHLVFVDASLPPLGGFAETAPSWLRDRLTARASATGRGGRGSRPTWTRWWDEDAMARLAGRPDRRRLVESELPRVPLAYLDQVVPVPDGWADGIGCSYLWCGDDHGGDAREAQRRGWRVRRVGGHHLLAVTSPGVVAKELFWTAVGVGGETPAPAGR